ncbi:hypothetical protein BJY24_000583 [Nocardia transvalensis]|uniref:Uncharacterized protein n=1 Tax=Nocardia transvalensis TaxID=37333 RepID=A0A7W9UG54_9NOCA|nr:hypothetical protein [Nocardia transvalensis]MBB5911716.1 hypothetical protein [Nocardia transvalensis]
MNDHCSAASAQVLELGTVVSTRKPLELATDRPTIRPRAIAYVNSALPGWPENESLVCQHALKLGYTIARLVIFYAVMVEVPVTRLLETVRAHGAVVVVVPDLGHLGGDPARVCEVCDVETVCPPATYARVGEVVEGTA